MGRNHCNHPSWGNVAYTVPESGGVSQRCHSNCGEESRSTASRALTGHLSRSRWLEEIVISPFGREKTDSPNPRAFALSRGHTAERGGFIGKLIPMPQEQER